MKRAPSWPAAGSWRRQSAFSLLFACSSGCALTSKAVPLSPRYFSPQLEAASASLAPQPRLLELRLGRVEAAAHIEQRMAYRPSDSELGYYEGWRWTEPPEAYLERALAQELFEQGGLVRVVAGLAPTLEIQLLGFEELKSGVPRARVEIRVALHDERRSLLERTLRIERPIESGPLEAEPLRLTQAFSLALAQAVEQVGLLVRTRLEVAP